MSTDVTTASQQVRQRAKELLQKAGGTPQQIADTIRLDDPGLYDDYMAEQGWWMFQRAVADMLRNIRSIERDRRDIAKIMDRIAQGDPDVVAVLDVLVEGVDGLMRLGEMRKEDHVAAAVAYELTASEATHYAKIHRDIARKLKPGQRTDERFSEAEIRRIYKKYGGQ